MKLFTGWVLSAGLVLSAPTANAQLLAPNHVGNPSIVTVSDFDGPYAAMPPEVPAPRYGPAYGPGPGLLPPIEVYAVLRENGFLPLGIPRQRGLVYTIAVIEPGGSDGRLVIDARSGRIIRFIPADGMDDDYRGDLSGAYGPAGPLPPATPVRSSVPRPPAPIPHVASRTVPKPRPNPLAAKRAPEPAQQSAAVQQRPAETQQAIPPAAAPTVGEAKPAPPAAPTILPTQEMPQVQGLE
ncbi:hypothetical protein OZ411_17640 [Bradyrhizobium sp. Arg237L]|uniref:hypothetical protein n=1 Tax=Bradyrhizobium sp. Arg237L TaxID=3003352 RepID=UPI00249EF035|nr:hypothetical protein [Bradyrhizobium sp. Arg237L]MDI4234628.1 hypothetical protein [Bradyrhizobium sp. Arg237L]